jgi:hypothetical protein|tara:strand:- start:37 stop:207 length:171 start_codon:yes stop_codon:yes gene_type:complete
MNKMFETVKRFVNSPLMRFLLALGAMLALVVKKEIFMAGVACGIAIREFLLAFKED